MYQMRRVLGLLSLRRHSGGVSGMANKGIMYIDGQRVPFDGEPNVLSVIRKAGIEMPTFCYYSDLSVYGACRMCVVEVAGVKTLVTHVFIPVTGMAWRSAPTISV